jgi:serine/threonine protein kinase
MNKLLSEGGFGCIYYPGYTCNGKTRKDKKFVTKIHKNNQNAKNETYIGKYISKNITDFNLYFLPVISKCPVNLELMNTNVFNECTIVKKYNDFDFVQMKIPYIANKPFFSFLTTDNNTKKDNLANIIETYQYLLHSLKILVKYDIIHFDLKSENILYNKDTNTPLIIDFGISILHNELDMQNLKQHFYIYAPDYYIWCLEIHIISYILHKLDGPFTLKIIKKISSDFIYSNKGFAILSKEFINKMYHACISFLQPYVNKSSDFIIKEMMHSYQTWDNYSLSILYLQILHILFENGFVKNDILIEFTQLLLENIHPHPHKRHDIEYTIKKQKNIFYENGDNKNYLNLLDNLDYKNVTKSIQTLQTSLNRKI